MIVWVILLVSDHLQMVILNIGCNVPNPPTGEADATMALTIWATSPMNMWIHKNAENRMHWSRTYTDAIVYHTQRKQHSFIQALIHMFITFINSKYGCRSKIGKITYLMKNSFRNQLRRCNIPPNHRPACSLISQQRCHPRARHDSPRNKGTSRLTHSQGYTNTAKSTQLGSSGHPGVGKG